ncbi:hypothetical protein LVD15_05685 [Fulvivirga maritima]|uniref:hypothetical protein n=1 Tax=Fulvivirga maritima TaxID=2904247 RepID=UPI001F2F1366|nr:hypothetical protein [Fulvivirga maritima]UII27911.1 hypothetical protein LVD15_05685 [Fulvivirga maritima]
MLNRDNIPYLFVALIGILTWSLNNIIENSKQSPILEYSFRTKNDITNLKLTNLSSAIVLTSLNFNLCLKDSSDLDSLVSEPIVIAIPPAYSMQKEIDSNSISERCFDFIIDEIQPNGEFIVRFRSLNRGQGILIMKSSGGQAVRIMNWNFLTIAIKYQLIINVTVFILSIITLLIYYIYLLKKR